MKTYVSLSLIALLCTSAWAAKISHPKCKDILQVTDEFTPQYMALVDGYDKSGKKTGEDVDVGGLVTESAQLKQACQKQKTKTMAAVRKQIASTPPPSNTSARINPLKANCEEFVALDQQYQPVAAFWVAGHAKSGKAIKSGEVGEEFLARPVVTLVEDCKANPKASFYSRAKAWMEKTTM